MHFRHYLGSYCAVKLAVMGIALLLLVVGLGLTAIIPSPVVIKASEAQATPTSQCSRGWEIVSSPSHNVYSDELFGISTLSSDDIWAVGQYSLGYPKS